jgi:hypothetical protein
LLPSSCCLRSFAEIRGRNFGIEVELLRTIRHLYAERSGGVHGVILDRINHFVRLPDGGPIRGITVALTPAEMERYRTVEVNLAELPDRSDFLAELDRILSIVIQVVGQFGPRGPNPHG